ncbi:MAG: hypothetical protein GX173_04685 [Ruminococcaceae bacterium]|nr:hypothetical protein [Oscillospiraceae bacterium]
MKTILCTGDSHTWGQGIAGLEDTFNPPVQPGDLRLVSFQYNGYVNLLRGEINSRTASDAVEYAAADLQRLSGTQCWSGSVLLDQDPLHIDIKAALFRIQFHVAETPSEAAVYVDGKLLKTIRLRPAKLTHPYQTESFFCTADGQHRLTIQATMGTIALYRLETYTGVAALLNCGIGRCPTGRFLEEYWEDYVARLQPSLVIMEPHTINDWLTGDPPQVYRAHLIEMIERLQAMSCAVILLTVAPIAGPQAMPFNKISYDAYMEESRKAARICSVPLCDANALMCRQIAGMSEEQARRHLFHDNWHVNELGHRIYADAAKATMIDLII